MIRKIPTMNDIREELKVIINDLKFNYSAWGDASDTAREKLIRRLQKIRNILNKSLRIEFKRK